MRISIQDSVKDENNHVISETLIQVNELLDYNQLYYRVIFDRIIEIQDILVIQVFDNYEIIIEELVNDSQYNELLENHNQT